MYIPFEVHAGQKDNLKDFILGVKEIFNKSIEIYERSVQDVNYGEDMATTAFSFSVVNGGYAEALLEDDEIYTDN